jgi:hypothetical protein
MSRFDIDITRWVEKANGNASMVVRKVCLDLFRRVIMRTPVDTGRARGNWQCDIGSIPIGAIATTDKSGAGAISRASSKALRAQAGEIVYLVNSLPYIGRLENGWSQQAPAGMVGVTVAEYAQVAEQAAREVS